MNTSEKTYRQKEQRALGYICLLLPVMSVGLGLIGHWRGVNEPGWYQSISATYYANSRIMMIGLLFLLSIKLWLYRGYDKGDNFISSISAITTMGVLIFPTADIGATQDEIVGLFCLPLEISGKIHIILAIILFTTFILQAMRFTKHGTGMSAEKKKRNIVYYICIAMMIIGILFILSINLIDALCNMRYLIFIGECFLMAGYGTAWLVKGGRISCLNDND